MSMAVTWHWLHVGPLDMYLARKVSFKDTLVHKYAPRKAPALCSKIVFRTVLSLDVSTQTVFLYYMSVKYIWRVISYVFGVHVTHWLLCQTDEINIIFQPSYVIYMRAYVHFSTIANICWLIKKRHSNTNVEGPKCILNRILLYKC